MPTEAENLERVFQEHPGIGWKLKGIAESQVSSVSCILLYLVLLLLQYVHSIYSVIMNPNKRLGRHSFMGCAMRCR